MIKFQLFKVGSKVASRDIALAKEYCSGISKGKLSKKYNISGARVNQIINRYVAFNIRLNKNIINSSDYELIIQNNYRNPIAINFLTEYENQLNLYKKNIREISKKSDVLNCLTDDDYAIKFFNDIFEKIINSNIQAKKNMIKLVDKMFDDQNKITQQLYEQIKKDLAYNKD